nr:hypothetical protein [Tanacetum cinerariifolium]
GHSQHQPVGLGHSVGEVGGGVHQVAVELHGREVARVVARAQQVLHVVFRAQPPIDAGAVFGEDFGKGRGPGAAAKHGNFFHRGGQGNAPRQTGWAACAAYPLGLLLAATPADFSFLRTAFGPIPYTKYQSLILLNKPWLLVEYAAAGSATGLGRYPRLVRVAAATLFLYAPLLLVSGFDALGHNQYVKPVADVAAYWRSLPAEIWVIEGRLTAEKHVGGVLALAVLIGGVYLTRQKWQEA